MEQAVGSEGLLAAHEARRTRPEEGMKPAQEQSGVKWGLTVLLVTCASVFVSCARGLPHSHPWAFVDFGLLISSCHKLLIPQICSCSPLEGHTSS